MTLSSYSSSISESITCTMSGYGFSVGSSGYDNEDRLVNWQRSDSNLNQAWNLSLVGDWTSITENSGTQNRTHGPTHELVSVASQNVTHDAKGNMALIPACLRSSPSSLKSPASRLTRDLGRRVARTANSATTIYFQSGQQTIADYTAGTAASSPTYNYVYASYIDEPVMRSTGSSGAKHFFHRNQQYSITALTDSIGAIIERYACTAYGTPTITDASGTPRTTTAVGNRYTYTGREWDETLALYHYRARMYDSVAGRFASRDPIGYAGSKWNLTEYVSGHPLSKTDPSGLKIPGAVRKCCNGVQYSPINRRCCGGKTIFNPVDNYCENGQVVDRVKIWVVNFPRFKSGYVRNICRGWDTLLFPLNLLGLNPMHAVICLDGPMSGCVGASENHVVENQTAMVRDECSIDMDDVRIEEKLICPNEKLQIQNEPGQYYWYNTFIRNCHHWSCGHGAGVW